MPSWHSQAAFKVRASITGGYTMQIADEDAFITYMTTEIPPAPPEAMRTRDINPGRLAVEG